MTAIKLRLEKCELIYEGTFSNPAFSMLDSPGRICDVLMRTLEPFGASADDLTTEDGEPGEWGITCEINEIDLATTVRGDRVEIRFPGPDKLDVVAQSKILDGVWTNYPGFALTWFQGCTRVSSNLTPRSWLLCTETFLTSSQLFRQVCQAEQRRQSSTTYPRTVRLGREHRVWF